MNILFLLPLPNLDLWLELLDRYDGRLLPPPLPPAAHARIHAHRVALALGAPWMVCKYQQKGVKP